MATKDKDNAVKAVVLSNENLDRNKMAGNLEGYAAGLKDLKKGIEVTSEYYSFGKELAVGECMRVIVIGATKIDKKGGAPGEKTVAVRLLLETGKAVVSGDAVLASTLGELGMKIESGEVKPVAYEITNAGMETSARGEYADLKIFTLS